MWLAILLKIAMTNLKFQNLKRYEDGSIVDFEEVFFLLTQGQLDSVSDDDFSRYLEEMENLRYEDYWSSSFFEFN